MTFLYPSFLWALAALAIPVIVHLFNFRKTQKIYFSNTRVIQQVQEATSSTRRLKHWLVLTSRLLFVFFLVMVFAQPIIPAREQLKAGEDIAVYIDNSYSMSAPLANGQQAFGAALSIAKTIVENFPADTRYRLLTNDFEPFANSLKTKNQVLDQLAQLRLSGRARTAGEIQNRLAHLGTEQVVFWISDFQQATIGNTLTTDTTTRYHLVPLQSVARSNVYIDTAYFENPFAIGGERNQLTVKLFNDGDEARNQLTVRLSLNGLQAGTASVSLAANASDEVQFEVLAQDAGTQQAVLSFTDNPVAFDNEFFATLQFSERIRILEIKSSNTVSHIEKVYGNTSVFDFTTYSSRNIDYSKFPNTDLVVLNEISQFDKTLVQALQQYLQQGGSVLIVPAGEPILSSYHPLVPTLAMYKQKEMLPLVSPDFDNPFFENIFQESATQMAMPVVHNTVTWGADRQALLQQVDGTPYLSLMTLAGKVYVLGSPLQATHGSFYSHALFVPVMYRIAAFSQRKKPALYQLTTQPQVSFTASIPTNAVVMLAGQQELTPSQRNFNQQIVMDVSGLEILPGHYAIKNGDDTISQVAFNQAKAESKMKTLSIEALVTLFKGQAEVYTVGNDPSNSIAESVRNTYQGKPLWKYALLLALLFIAVEIALLRFWR